MYTYSAKIQIDYPDGGILNDYFSSSNKWNRTVVEKMVEVQANEKEMEVYAGDFWELAGSLKSDIVLSDKELKKAREDFGKNWIKEWKK